MGLVQGLGFREGLGIWGFQGLGLWSFGLRLRGMERGGGGGGGLGFRV